VRPGRAVPDELRRRAEARRRAGARWAHPEARQRPRAAGLHQPRAAPARRRAPRSLRIHLAPAHGATRRCSPTERKMIIPLTSVTKNSAKLVLTLVGDYPVSQQRLWDAFSDPRQLERFWGPPTMPATFTRHEFKVGGRAEYVLTGPKG